MRRGASTGLVLIVSIIVIILIITQYFIFFVILPKKSIQVDIKEYLEKEMNLPLITFVKLNSDLIVRSVKNNNYIELENEIKKINFGDCWEIKVQNKVFNNCNVKKPEISTIIIPDYNNNPIEIELKVDKR